MLFGGELGAELARKLDIVDEITDHSDLEAVVNADVRGFVANDDLAVRRRLLQDSLSSSFDEAWVFISQRATEPYCVSETMRRNDGRC